MNITKFRLILPLTFAALVAGVFPRTSTAQQNEDPSPVMVTVTEMHICCGACKKAIEKAGKIDGVQVEVNQDEGMAVLTAATYRDVQEALNAIAKTGFSGKIEDDTQAGKVSFPEIKTPDGNVRKLTVRHIHNCCRGCSEAISEAVESVDGVKEHNINPKKETFVVEGNFDAGEVVAALLDAGFYPSLK